jgi:hypothetical protein
LIGFQQGAGHPEIGNDPQPEPAGGEAGFTPGPFSNQVPLLRHVIELLAGERMAVMIEFKSPEPELQTKVHRILAEANMLGDAACFSLDKEINAALRSIPEFFLCSEVTKIVSLLLTYHFGLIGWVYLHKQSPSVGSRLKQAF